MGMQARAVQPGAGEPRREGGFGVSKDSYRGPDRQTFRERREHFTDPLRLRFQKF
ncbi:MAG: hypothetical protein HZB51_06430 [Chloroflexi bacterium]|nr:hypothetical protein [Chloroflexota bacterium]